MPVYAYRCRACALDLDVRQSILDDELVDCPSCGAAELRKRITPIAIAFKGSGFYKTDAA